MWYPNFWESSDPLAKILLKSQAFSLFSSYYFITFVTIIYNLTEKKKLIAHTNKSMFWTPFGPFLYMFRKLKIFLKYWAPSKIAIPIIKTSIPTTSYKVRKWQMNSYWEKLSAHRKTCFAPLTSLGPFRPLLKKSEFLKKTSSFLLSNYDTLAWTKNF